MSNSCVDEPIGRPLPIEGDRYLSVFQKRWNECVKVVYETIRRKLAQETFVFQTVSKALEISKATDLVSPRLRVYEDTTYMLRDVRKKIFSRAKVTKTKLCIGQNIRGFNPADLLGTTPLLTF